MRPLAAVLIGTLLFLFACEDKDSGLTSPTIIAQDTGRFVVDTFSVRAYINSQGKAEVSARIVFHFEIWSGSPEYLSVSASNIAVMMIPEYSVPIATDRAVLWIPTIPFSDSLPGVDSVTFRAGISGWFWTRDTTYGRFAWRDSARVFVTR
jgi:hypothetical protein